MVPSSSSQQQLPRGFDPVHFLRVSSAIRTLEQDPDTAPRMEYLRKAYNAFSGPAEGRTKPNLQEERAYLEFYRDLPRQPEFWFRRIFAEGVPMSHVFCEWTVGILGTLATIRRQRGDVAKCLEVLQLDERVLRQYQKLTSTDEQLCRNPAATRCVAGLTYKYNLIASNAHQQAGNKEECLKAFRAAARYEIEQKYSWDRQNLVCMIRSRADVMGKDYMSVDFLDQTPDDYIWSMLMAALQLSGDTRPSKTVEPWICDGCGDEEESCGDYKRCKSCRRAYYCTRDCQVKHWKVHKTECKETGHKSTSTSMMQDIKKFCKKTIQNYSDAVKSGTGKDVSEEHKKAAFPSLVELAKKYILEHPRLNPQEAFINTASDLQFRQQIDAFMEAQPGFEVLDDPRKHSITDEDRLALIAAEQMEFYEGRLLEVAKQTVAGMAPYFAAWDIAPDAQEQDRACRHVVTTVQAYVADHPEYQTPENFATAMREEKFTDMIATALVDYFNGMTK